MSKLSHLNLSKKLFLVLFLPIAVISLKTLYRLVFYGLPLATGVIHLKYLFSLTFILRIFCQFCIFYLLVVIGKIFKNALNFKYISTGILSFFAITFLLNFFASMVTISSANLELVILYVVVLAAIVYHYLNKNPIYELLILIPLFIILQYFPKVTFLHSSPFLGDEKIFWFPASVDYYTNGLRFVISNNYGEGWFNNDGLFIHHIWVTLKRLLFLNGRSVDEFYLFSQMLFFLGFFFIWENCKELKTKIIAIFTCFICLISQAFLFSLFGNNYMGDGPESWIFAVLLCENINNSFNFESNRINYFLFFITGILYATKPFARYFLIFFPLLFLLNKQRDTNIFKLLSKIFTAFLIMLLIPLLWKYSLYISGKINMLSQSIKSFTLNISMGEVILLLKVFLKDKITLILMPTLLAISLFGLNKSNKKELFISYLFIILNIFCIFFLFSSSLKYLSDEESAYRYFFQMFYVIFYVFCLGLNSYFEKKQISY